MLLLVGENSLDQIAAGGIVSGRRCLRRRVEHGTGMALQRHVVVKYLADCGTNSWRLDSERGCAVEIAEAIQQSINRNRLIRSPQSHLAGKTFETQCFDENDMGLMLRVSAPRCTKQAIQDRKHRLGSPAHAPGALYLIAYFRINRHRILLAYTGGRVVPATGGGGSGGVRLFFEMSHGGSLAENLPL